MFIEADGLASLQAPAAIARYNAVSAIFGTLDCVLRYISLGVFEPDVCDWQVVRVVRHEIAPRTEDDAQVFREVAIFIKICVYQFKLFGKRKKFRFRYLCGEANHHLQVVLIWDIARGMPAEEPAVKRGIANVHLVNVGMLKPDFEIVFEIDLVFLETKTTSARIAPTCTRGIWSTCDNWRKIDRGDLSA